ncbi:MAG: hypothetical protein ACOCUI_00395 [bacterium]
MNGLLNLSERECQVLSILLKLDAEWTPRMDSDYKNILSTDNRKILMRETLINKNNLSKYIKTLKSKGLIIEDDEKEVYEIQPMIKPNVMDNKARLSFILELEEDAEK